MKFLFLLMLFIPIESNAEWKSRTELELKALKDFKSSGKSASSSNSIENDNKLVKAFYKEHCTDGLLRNKSGHLVERCYYTYSPINNSEFFIFKYENGYILSKDHPYCTDGQGGQSYKRVTVWRVSDSTLGALYLAKKQNDITGDFNILNYIGAGDKCPFEDTFYNVPKGMTWRCGMSQIVRTKSYSGPYGSDSILYETTSCMKSEGPNKINIAEYCNLYTFKNPIKDGCNHLLGTPGYSWNYWKK